MENTLLYMSNTFLEAFLKFRTSWQWQLQYGIYYRNTVLYCLTSFYWKFPINNDEIGLPISKLREKPLLHISNSFLELSLKFKKVNNDGCIRENNLESLFLYCLTNFHWTLPNKIGGFGLPLSKLRESILLLHMSNTFLEVFLKFQTKLENLKQVIVTVALWELF